MHHDSLAGGLENRVLRGPGKTDPALRRRVAERACGGPPIEPPYDELALAVGDASRWTTDAQVEALLAATGSQKGAFEVIAAAAVGAGLMRRQCAIEACAAANDAII
jgi:hypothetical protein